MSNPSARPYDQPTFSGASPSSYHKPLMGRRPGQGDGRSLERIDRRGNRQKPGGRQANILGKHSREMSSKNPVRGTKRFQTAPTKLAHQTSLAWREGDRGAHFKRKLGPDPLTDGIDHSNPF
jgi:hypothetical protein